VVNKKQALEELLKLGRVQVAIDMQANGVRVPLKFAGEQHLILNLSWNYHNDMVIDDWGVTATLSFDGRAFRCELPWDSIIAARSFPEGKLQHQTVPKSDVKKTSHLRVVK
jgi:stringent starvation protein B